jgi:uncharacterized protein (DUF58 family)
MPTAQGLLVAVVALVALGTGAALRYWEILAVGLALALSLAVAGASVVRPPRLAVTRPPGNLRVREGATVTIEATVTNRNRRRCGPFLVRDEFAGATVSQDVPALLPGESHAVRLRLAAPARGCHRLGPLRIERIDPLGLVARSHRVGPAPVVWVHPRTRAFVGPPTPTAPGVSGPLRPYQPGDRPGRVHWPSSARRDGRLNDLVVIDPAGELERLVVVLDTDPASYATDPPGPDFDEAVRLAASVVVDALARYRPVDLCTGAAVTRIEPGARGRVEALDRLAEVGPGGADDLAGRRPPGPVVVVTGPRAPVPAALARRAAVRILRVTARAGNEGPQP